MTPTIKEIVGEVIWLRLRQELGSKRVYIPKLGCSKEENRQRDARIRAKYKALLDSGLTNSSAIQQLVLEFGISDTRIRHILT